MKEKLRKVIEIYKNKTKKECYEIVIDNSEDIGIKDNKIGGKAYMPKGEEYPLDEDGNPMILLIQINLKDIDPNVSGDDKETIVKERQSLGAKYVHEIRKNNTLDYAF